MVAREMSASRMHSHNTATTSASGTGQPAAAPAAGAAAFGGGATPGPSGGSGGIPLHQMLPPPHAAAVGLRHTSSSGSGSGSFLADELGLQRASSMNLPKPQESGVPDTHPDMCILRIRRNHLVEVCPVIYHIAVVLLVPSLL